MTKNEAERHANTPSLEKPQLNFSSYSPLFTQEEKLGCVSNFEGDRFINFRYDNEDIEQQFNTKVELFEVNHE